MRFKIIRKYPEKKTGNKRIITKFLLFPKIINDEFRWLESATIEQEFQQVGRMYRAASNLHLNQYK
jgi:hypothetical protein